jgi:ABC-type sugar transport system permease subunit
VTLPLLSPAMFFVIIMAAIWTLQEFEQVYNMTEGGPADATNVLVLRIYRQAFRYFRMGDASALSMILFAIILLFTYLQFRYSKWVHY